MLVTQAFLSEKGTDKSVRLTVRLGGVAGIICEIQPSSGILF
jgi:hypothetical protein